MNRRDGVHLGPALRQLGPLTALGCSFVLGGVLGSLMVSLIAGQAAQELESFLRDYLSAAQAGEIQARFWPMLWEQGRFLIGLCILGVTALGVAGIPVLFLARGFLFSFSVAAFCRIFGPVGLASAFFLFGLPALRPGAAASGLRLLGEAGAVWAGPCCVCDVGVYGGPGAAEGRRPVCVVNASVWEKELSACRSYWTCMRSI